MDVLIQVLRYEVWGLLLILAAVIAYRLLNGDIRTVGLICDKAPGGTKRGPGLPPKRGPGQFSPARLQLLIFTVVGALYYLMLVFKVERPGEFPEIPSWLLLGLSGSHAFYLGGKLSAMLWCLFGARGARG